LSVIIECSDDFAYCNIVTTLYDTLQNFRCFECDRNVNSKLSNPYGCWLIDEMTF